MQGLRKNFTLDLFRGIFVNVIKKNNNSYLARKLEIRKYLDLARLTHKFMGYIVVP